MENVDMMTSTTTSTSTNSPFFTTNMLSISHSLIPTNYVGVGDFKDGLLGLDFRHGGDHGEELTGMGIGSSSGAGAGYKENKKEKKIRKHRFAFHTRSQVDILDDGYRWRKYGQKAVKNNKFPRSYYRCTYVGCNVKKQVQRLTKDEEIVVTTYEGVHTHPVERSTDDFEHILKQMQIYVPPP